QTLLLRARGTRCRTSRIVPTLRQGFGFLAHWRMLHGVCRETAWNGLERRARYPAGPPPGKLRVWARATLPAPRPSTRELRAGAGAALPPRSALLNCGCGWGRPSPTSRLRAWAGAPPSTPPYHPGARPTPAPPPGWGNCGETAGGGVRGVGRLRGTTSQPAHCGARDRQKGRYATVSSDSRRGDSRV